MRATFCGVGRVLYVLRHGDNEYPLSPGNFTIGRSSDCSLPLDDAMVSRVHVVIRVGDDGAVVQDAGSSNGTRLNGELLERAQPLHDGHRLTLGSTRMTVHVVEQLPVESKRRSRDETLPLQRAPGQVRSTFPPPRVAEDSPLAQLSKREREVMHLIALGHTHKEVAEHLELSPKTVEGYRARLTEKLGVKSRADIVQLALQEKLLT